MTAYGLFDIREIHDEAAMERYRAEVVPIVESFGGRYVVIGGPWQVVEGDWRPAFPVMITFPDLASANAWYGSEAYRELKALRVGAAVSDAVFFDSAGAEEHAGPVTAVAPRRVGAAAAPLEVVGRDLYRDVHKGIRNELFALTAQLGNLDPGAAEAAVTVGDRVGRLFELLDAHARHEDDHVGVVLAGIDPALERRIAADHAALEAAMAEIRRLGEDAAVAPAAVRGLAVRRWYLAFAAFTSDYLTHEATEELEAMPVMARALGDDELAELEERILASIGPDHLAGYLRLILPAVNPDERAALLGDMKAGAPEEAFAAAATLAGEVLSSAEIARLLRDLG